jgi:hypothetical protein
VNAQCNTRLTEGEEEKSWRNRKHDNNIITRAFFITKESTQRVYSVVLIFFPAKTNNAKTSSLTVLRAVQLRASGSRERVRDLTHCHGVADDTADPHRYTRYFGLFLLVQ